MKKRTLSYIFLSLLCLTTAQAQVINTLGTGIQQGNTWYAIYENKEYKEVCAGLFHITIHPYDYSVPGDKLTFDAKHTLFSVNGEIYINADGSKNADYTIQNNRLSTEYQSFGAFSIPQDWRTLYVRAGDGSLTRYIRNLHLTMASYLKSPSASSLTFNSKAAGSEAETKTFTFDWCNAGDINVTYTGDAAFSVTTTKFSTNGKYGNATISVTCNHNQTGTHTGTVTISNGTITHTVTLNGSTQPLAQTITWNVAHTYFTTADSFLCNATASSGLPVTYTSSNPAVVQVNADGSLLFLSAGEATITATQPGNNIYAAAMPVSYTFHITKPTKEWICLISNNGTIGGDVYIASSDTVYNNLLYWMDENAANLLGYTPVDVQSTQHIIMPIEADQWTTFVPPFDITDVRILELIPEDELHTKTRTEAIRLQQDRANLLAEYIYTHCNNSATEHYSFEEMLADIFQQWTAQYSYATNALGIYSLTHYNGTNLWDADYYAYTTSSTWNVSDNTQSGIQKQWQPVTDNAGVIFRQGQVYTLQFPYCTGCQPSDKYDYWSGKLLILSHSGSQTVYGEEQHSNILTTTPEEGNAALTGNYTLCRLNASDIFLHEKDINSAYYDCFVKQQSAKVLPTQTIVFADIASTQARKPIAIRRSGEIIYDNAQENNQSTDVQSLPCSSSLSVVCHKGIAEITATQTQDLFIYTACGKLCSHIVLQDKQTTRLSLPQGIYILKTQSECKKLIIQE